MHKVTWLYVLNGMPHFHYSCTILKPKHYHLVSDFKIRPGLLLTSGTWNLTLFLKKSTETATKVSRICCYIPSSVGGFDQYTSLWTNPQKDITYNKTGTLQRPFCCSSTPNLPIRKMVAKPHTSRKCKMWWCFVLHDFPPFLVVPFRNNVKDKGKGVP